MSQFLRFSVDTLLLYFVKKRKLVSLILSKIEKSHHVNFRINNVFIILDAVFYAAAAATISLLVLGMDTHNITYIGNWLHQAHLFFFLSASSSIFFNTVEYKMREFLIQVGFNCHFFFIVLPYQTINTMQLLLTGGIFSCQKTYSLVYSMTYCIFFGGWGHFTDRAD